MALNKNHSFRSCARCGTLSGVRAHALLPVDRGRHTKRRPRHIRARRRSKRSRTSESAGAAASEPKLPARWPHEAKAVVLHVLSLSRFIMLWIRMQNLKDLRLEVDRQEAYVKNLLVVIDLLSARLSRIPAARRPHYTPEERMEILSVRAALGWTAHFTATTFLLADATITNWTARVAEHGEASLLVLKQPVNKWPLFVRDLVLRLAQVSPALGKKRITQMLGRAGLAIASSSVGRIRKEKPAPGACEAAPPRAGSTDPAPGSGPKKMRAVTAKHEHHVWHIDLTMLPLASPWVTWSPFALPPVFPFCYWLGAVIDQCTRKIVGFKLFLRQPTGAKVAAMIETAVAVAGHAPAHIVSDRGAQFTSAEYEAWCRAQGVKARFGAIGQHGSIALIERFFRTFKEECWRRLGVHPWRLRIALEEIRAFIAWYHEHRPHQGLCGLTPNEKAVRGRERSVVRARVEPRPRMPLARASPRRRAKRVTRLHVHIEPLRGRAHLPVVSLQS